MKEINPILKKNWASNFTSNRKALMYKYKKNDDDENNAKNENDNDQKLTEEEYDALMMAGTEQICSLYKCLDKTPREIEELINSEVIGQEDAIKKMVYVCYFNQIADLMEQVGYSNPPKRINAVMIGPTGCGKTSAINALAKYFDVPVVKYNADAITSAGYIGMKIEDILVRLMAKTKGDLELAERSIIFIDEFDKKCEQETSSGKDINGKAVQEELLKLLEPSTIDIEINKKRVPFYTGRLTVLLGGAFVGLEKVREKRLNKKSLGFSTGDVRYTEEELVEKGYVAKDLIDFGFIPEIVGRIMMINEFRKLEEEDILRIIRESKISVYRQQISMLVDYLGIEGIWVSKKFLEKIAEETISSGTGARSLESKITLMFKPIIEEAFEHNFEPGLCEIDEDGNYQLIYEDVTYYGETGK